MHIVIQAMVRYLPISPASSPMMLASAAASAGHASPMDFVNTVRVPRLRKEHVRTKVFRQIHAWDYV
jgi:hypothetical protein